jgi:NAD(P)-dependent dehydrogenase (short-subunit alcohol dehydrogenase family)
MSKRVCLLTGAGGKLGRAFCRLYRSQYDIVAVYRRSPPDVPSQRSSVVDPLLPAERLAENEHPVFAVQADLADDHQLTRVVELALARFDRVDLLVNAAADTAFLGSSLDHDRRLARIRAQVNVNTIVPAALAATVARLFWRDRPEENRAANRGVVHVSSVSGSEVFGHTGQSVYAASKAALDMMAAHMAHDLGPIGMRSNVVAPARFPDVVPAECVAEMIARLDEGTWNGVKAILDAKGERFVNMLGPRAR